MSDEGTIAFAYEAIAVSTVAIGFTAATFQPDNQLPARRAIITVEDNVIRLRYDGTSPTSTEGHQVATGERFDVWDLVNLRNLKMIQDSTAGGAADVKVTFER